MCGLQSMLGGVATQLAWQVGKSLRHGCWWYPLLSQHVGFYFLNLSSCTFSTITTIITSSMIMTSGHFWFMVVFMTGWAVKSLSVIFLLGEGGSACCWCKRLLYVAWMEHWLGCCQGFLTLSLKITRLPLRRSFFFYVWCVTRLMHDEWGHFQGAVFGKKTAVRSVVSFLMLFFLKSKTKKTHTHTKQQL